MRRRLVLYFGLCCGLFCSLVVGCLGEDPAFVPGGNGADANGSPDDASANTDGGSTNEAGSDGAANTGCSPIDGNLLSNGSFEKASSTGTLTAWEGAPLPIQQSGGADDCQFWAEVTTKDVEGMISHDFDLGIAADAGTAFEVGASVRTLDGDTTPIYFQLRVVNGNYKVGSNIPSLDPDGGWTRVSTVIELPDEGSKLSLEILTKLTKARSLGVDRVFVRRM